MAGVWSASFVSTRRKARISATLCIPNAERQRHDAESKILDFYRSEFVRLKVKPQRSGVALQHAAWMIEECLVMKFPDDMYKINRWIGFVQGVLWKEGIYTIDQMREHVTTAK